MKTVSYAQPYDISARGFFFSSAEEYTKEASTKTNTCGMQIEEFEVQFIEGERIDAELFQAMEVSQADISAYFEAVVEWDGSQKLRAIVAVRECGALLGLGDDPDALNIDFYDVQSLRELVEQFVEEGCYGDIPENLQFYIDYDAIERDLAVY